jgi:hypothetical protein
MWVGDGRTTAKVNLKKKLKKGLTNTARCDTIRVSSRERADNTTGA